LSIDAAELVSLAVGELVHCLLGNVETVTSIVDRKNVDRVAIVSDTVAGTALQFDKHLRSLLNI